MAEQSKLEKEIKELKKITTSQDKEIKNLLLMLSKMLTMYEYTGWHKRAILRLRDEHFEDGEIKAAKELLQDYL